jgi:hypothetical protein
VPVSPADRDVLESFGAAVVECSWARIDEVPMSRIGGRCERLRIMIQRFKAEISALSSCNESRQLRQTMAVELR